MLYRIEGYWDDDKETIDGMLVSDSMDIPESVSDEEIFFYFDGVEELDAMIKNKTCVNEDFTITSYRKVQ